MKWTHQTESYRYATSDDLAPIADMLSAAEVGRWLWFTPAPRETYEAFFTPFVDSQSKLLEEGQVPQTAVFAVESLSADFLGQGAVIAVEGSPGGFEIGFQLRQEAWGRGVGSRLAGFLCAYAVHASNAFRIEASCLEGNAGSRAILTKLGLAVEGKRIEYRLKEEVRHSELLFGAPVAGLDLDSITAVAREVGLI